MSAAGGSSAAPPVSTAAIPAAETSGGAGPAAPGESRRVSTSDIQLVQNLIERCLQMYMSQREVISTLHSQARIEPGFTSLVWQKLEEQNPQFFQAYFTRLKLKDQIVLFNHLLDQQVSIVAHCQNAWRQQQQQLAAQAQHAAAAQQAQPGAALQGMPGMQPAASLPGSLPATSAPAGAAASQPPPSTAALPVSDAGGTFNGGGPTGPGGLPTPDLGDLGDMQGVPGLSTSAAAASPPLFTGDSAGGGNLMAHGMHSSDNLVGLAQGYAPSPAYPSTSGDQGTGGEDIPRNFSMSDLHLFGGHDTMDGGHVHMALDAELDLGSLSTPLPAEPKSQPPAN